MDYISTDHGPMFREASPEMLAELLAEYEAVLASLGGPMESGLRPGMPKLETERALAARGLRPNEEVLVWLARSEGNEVAVGQGGTLPATFTEQHEQFAIGSYKTLTALTPCPVGARHYGRVRR